MDRYANAALNRPCRRKALVVLMTTLVGAAWFFPPVEAAGIAAKLLPPDEAFRFAARVLDTQTLEANFFIAKGYYLYRDKIAFVLEPANEALPAALPPGKLKDDEFFGRVETYRDRLVVRVPIGKAAGQSITLRAQSQGCADAGVCYPPHTQRVTLTVPATDGKPGPLVDATTGKRGWFK